MKLLDLILATMLCMLQAALPAVGTDYTLGIFGNANMDDTIDENDVAYVEGVIKGTNAATNLSDANYDGSIDAQDIDQIQMIIQGDEKELTLIDSGNNTVTAKIPLKRTVVLSSEVLETMLLMKVPHEEIIGINKWAKENNLFFTDISKNAIDLGSYTSPDYEKLLELKPDTVIEASSTRNDDAVMKIKEMNPDTIVLRFDCWRPSVFFDEVTKLGYLLGKRKEANDFIRFYENMLTLIQDKVKDIPESERPKVYLELGDTPYQTTGNKGAWHITLEMAGGRDLFGDIDEEYFVADPEEVVKRNPDIFVKKEYPEGGYDSNNLSEMIPERNELLNRTELANVKATRNGRVFLIDSSVFANPKFVIGIAYMAKWFYPDLFKDIDPQAFHKEYLERFIGIPYRGFYVYPPPS